MSARKSLSPMKRLKIFERALGRCHICEQRIKAGEKWEADHIIPLGLNGPDGEAYMAPAHEACHDSKTKGDVADIARAKRRKAKSLGIKKRSTFQTNRDGPYKQTIGGGIVRRHP